MKKKRIVNLFLAFSLTFPVLTVCSLLRDLSLPMPVPAYCTEKENLLKLFIFFLFFIGLQLYVSDGDFTHDCITRVCINSNSIYFLTSRLSLFPSARFLM